MVVRGLVSPVDHRQVPPPRGGFAAGKGSEHPEPLFLGRRLSSSPCTATRKPPSGDTPLGVSVSRGWHGERSQGSLDHGYELV